MQYVTTQTSVTVPVVVCNSTGNTKSPSDLPQNNYTILGHV